MEKYKDNSILFPKWVTGPTPCQTITQKILLPYPHGVIPMYLTRINPVWAFANMEKLYQKGSPVGILSGKITDRIKSGDIPAEATKKVDRADDKPSVKAIKSAEGHGLGKGATRGRNGGAS